MSHYCTSTACASCREQDAAGAASQCVLTPPVRPDGAQVQAIFNSLDAYGQSMVWSLLTCAARLQGVRG